MSLKAFFIGLLGLKKRTVTITRVGTPNITGTLICHPCVYTRDLEAAGDISVQGHEFIITKDQIATIAGLGTMKRGDKITDPELGTMTIKDPVAMYDIGGQILAWRCRTG